ncbi:aminodeoxychorismate synthase component I [Streptomyces sp. G45]|uniref:aminodeoxychorismate synthase component I n=1 Tax=Streptomyces sp. G45 TaxID=3406627 RepID=UPI003C1DDBBF
MRTLLVDNHDSYTFNLFQLLTEVNDEEPLVLANDEGDWKGAAALGVDNIVLGPGPGRPSEPKDVGLCRAIVESADVPVLGVCLGHQSIALEAGARVVRAERPAHGETVPVFHDASGLFAGIPQGFHAVRYHSLMVAEPFPENLRVTAWGADGTVMGVAHADRPQWGVQFHPESIASEYGHRLLRNFLHLTPKRRHGRPTGTARPRHAARTPGAEGAASGLRVLTRRLPEWTDPETVFTALYADQPHSFWLDSSRAEPGVARFSYLGGQEGPLSHVLRYDVTTRTLRTLGPGRASAERHTDLFDHLRRETARLGTPLGTPRSRTEAPGLPFDLLGGYVGYLGYELRADCVGTPEPAHRATTPDAALIFADRLLAFDHERGEVHAVALAEPGEESAAAQWLTDVEQRVARAAPPEPVPPTPAVGPPRTVRWARDHDAYLADIARCKRWLRDGESYEICLTNRAETHTDVDPLTLYRVLRRLNPAPYAAYLRFGDLAVLSSSPERFLRVGRDGRVQAKPIKGTTARAADEAEDRARAETLRTSAKDRAENLMIVDLLRNDLGRVCVPGSVRVPSLMAVETYHTVHHLVSTIEGQLRAGLGALDAVRAAFPPGSMTGAPKLRTMQLIDALEPGARGVYAGAIGWLGVDGAADLGVAIRTLVAQDGLLSTGAGGAVLWRSDPEAEAAEVALKAAPLLRALSVAESWARTGEEAVAV